MSTSNLWQVVFCKDSPAKSFCRVSSRTLPLFIKRWHLCPFPLNQPVNGEQPKKCFWVIKMCSSHVLSGHHVMRKLEAEEPQRSLWRDPHGKEPRPQPTSLADPSWHPAPTFQPCESATLKGGLPDPEKCCSSQCPMEQSKVVAAEPCPVADLRVK